MAKHTPEMRMGECERMAGLLLLYVATLEHIDITLETLHETRRAGEGPCCARWLSARKRLKETIRGALIETTVPAPIEEISGCDPIELGM